MREVYMKVRVGQTLLCGCTLQRAMPFEGGRGHFCEVWRFATGMRLLLVYEFHRQE